MEPLCFQWFPALPLCGAVASVGAVAVLSLFNGVCAHPVPLSCPVAALCALCVALTVCHALRHPRGRSAALRGLWCILWPLWAACAVWGGRVHPRHPSPRLCPPAACGEGVRRSAPVGGLLCPCSPCRDHHRPASFTTSGGIRSGSLRFHTRTRVYHISLTRCQYAYSYTNIHFGNKNIRV